MGFVSVYFKVLWILILDQSAQKAGVVNCLSWSATVFANFKFFIRRFFTTTPHLTNHAQTRFFAVMTSLDLTTTDFPSTVTMQGGNCQTLWTIVNLP